MDARTIARWRLVTQGLAGAGHSSPLEAVAFLLGVQAENYAQTIWGLAERTSGLTEEAFGRLFDSGEILRTHVLRPTWHFARRDDLRWLLELTAPRARLSVSQLATTLGLDGKMMDTAATVVVDLLGAGEHLTRDRLGELLRERGLPAEGMALGAMLSHAEMSGLICSGVRRQGAQTYALLEERAPHSRRLSRQEALAEIALRYFTGHGPATEGDLAYWATLGLAEVREGLQAVSHHLGSFQHDGLTYWYGEEPPPGMVDSPEPRGHLLLILDEYYRGYQASRRVLDAAGLEPPGHRAVGMALVDGQIVGSMKRTLRTGSVRLDVATYRRLAADEGQALEEAAVRYGDFLGLQPDLRLETTSGKL